MKALFAVLIAGMAYCQIAQAQSSDAPPEATKAPPRLPTGEGFIVSMENDSFDLFANRPYADRFYTHGTHASVLTKWRPAWSSRLADALRMGDEDTRISFSIVQNIYTPRDISVVDPSPNDRPYAGLLYGAAALIEASPDELNTLELRLGLVGPSALSWLAQDTRHDAINLARANGWRYQLEDEPTASIAFEHRSAPTDVPTPTWGLLPRIEHTHLVGAEIGTLRTAAVVGGAVTARWGDDSDYGPTRGWPGPMTSSFTRASPRFWDTRLFLGANLQLVARDITLNGTVFRDSAQVDHMVVVGELQAGFTIRVGWFRAGWARVARTPEFKQQGGDFQEFERWSITMVPISRGGN